jgi:SAM-dependent methyltransferase
MQISEQILKGAELYGNDMSLAEIETWYRDEEYGYFDLKEQKNPEYGYFALNNFHAFNWLKRRRFKTCVAIGCADGQDVSRLAAQVDRFIGIEPAEKWWRDEISGTPASFLKPDISGKIPLQDQSVDLVTSLGTLHHIPNVGRVIEEVSRILEPGGVFVLREPMSSMGDWRKPRRGLTARERGIPFNWLAETLRNAGLKPVRSRRVMFALTNRLALFSKPYNSSAIVFLDWIASELMAWNDHYWRDKPFKKVAATSSYFIAVKD